MRVAIVHHWFVTQGGGERVAGILAGMLPGADVFTLVMDPEQLPPELAGRSVTTSILQRIPGAKRMHRHLLPLYPFAVEQLDLSAYDLILTSDSGPMKGIITHQNAIQICYCHSPMRYLWDGYHDYLSGMKRWLRLPFSLAAHYVRNWDFVAAQRVTQFVANSRYVAKRIEHFYSRDSTVIHPPVDISRGFLADTHSDYYLAAGRLVGYKRTELLVKACTRLGRRLRVAGSGPELKALRRIAGPTIEFVGALSDDDLWNEYAHCRALLFAADEDFGMVPVEAQACGRPVIAYGRGGALETVCGRHHGTPGDLATGVFFQRQTVDDVVNAMLEFEAHESSFSPIAIQRHAAQFSTPIFIEKMHRLIENTLAQHPGLQETSHPEARKRRSPRNPAAA
ncbi:MAG TPA: glycosyltransferase [Granulicella sp.]|nr:glycosyltransferase [Granulicella sp.]